MPKYASIVSWAKERLASGAYKPGERFYTEMELAARFSCSRQTVRHALTQLALEGYIDRARGSGTYVSRRSGSPASMNIGVISTYLDSYIFPNILQGIEAKITEHGYPIQFAVTNNRVQSEERALRDMLDKGVDGLIVEPTKSGLPCVNQPLYREIERRGVPIVFFNAYYRELSFPYVAIDDRAAGLIATRRLLGAGHARILGVFILDDLQGHLRYQGYMEALREAGDSRSGGEHVLWYSTDDFPQLFRYPARIMDKLGGASAVFCYNDQLAVRMIEFLRAQGKRIPQDIAVVGVDNCDLSALCAPPLTTVSHPKRELGYRAADLLIRMIEGAEAEPFLYQPELIERGSVREVKA